MYKAYSSERSLRLVTKHRKVIGCGEMASGGCHHSGAHHSSITLPLGPLPRHAIVALDMGGSLIKVAYIKESHTNETSKDITIELVTFSVDNIDSLITFLKTDVLGTKNSHKVQICATGVGSLKFKDKMEEDLDADLMGDCKEMQHAVHGLDFLWRNLKPEHLLYPESVTTDLNFGTSLEESGLMPGIVVNIGSALSIVQIQEKLEVKYIGGGITAGHTFLGLGALLIGNSNFEELHQLAESGNRGNLDLYVKDTAGSGYNFSSPDAMVSSFGRAARLHSENQSVKFSNEDLAASLLHNIVDQIGSTAYLVAKAHNINSAVFCGSFMSNSQMIRHQIKVKVQECSVFLQHDVKPVFVRYEHYLGAIGSLLSHLEQLPQWKMSTSSSNTKTTTNGTSTL